MTTEQLFEERELIIGSTSRLHDLSIERPILGIGIENRIAERSNLQRCRMFMRACSAAVAVADAAAKFVRVVPPGAHSAWRTPPPPPRGVWRIQLRAISHACRCYAGSVWFGWMICWWSYESIYCIVCTIIIRRMWGWKPNTSNGMLGWTPGKFLDFQRGIISLESDVCTSNVLQWRRPGWIIHFVRNRNSCVCFNIDQPHISPSVTSLIWNDKNVNIPFQSNFCGDPFDGYLRSPIYFRYWLDWGEVFSSTGNRMCAVSSEWINNMSPHRTANVWQYSPMFSSTPSALSVVCFVHATHDHGLNAHYIVFLQTDGRPLVNVHLHNKMNVSYIRLSGQYCMLTIE